MDTIRNYRNEVRLRFSEIGKNFTLKVPHYNKWLSIIKFLRNRGFIIGENEYYKKEYTCLSKYHKIGFKKDVVCLMEISGSFIAIEFGNKKNLWKNMPNNFWSNPEDERFSKLSYLESAAVKLEIKKLLAFCKKYNLNFIKEENSLSPEEYIINKDKINTHIHGHVECLNDIKLYIKENSYNYLNNSNDKNNKKIICGETKYFYDYYTKRLSCGVVWHNINNMWWVIAGGKLTNRAAFDLFDFDPNLPRREKADERKIDYLLKTFEGKKDYEKCIKIRNYAEKILEVA